MPIYFGAQVYFNDQNGTGELTGPNHIPYLVNGESLIDHYKDCTFTEYIHEVDPNSYITNDGEKLFSFGEVKETIKREIIYVKK